MSFDREPLSKTACISEDKLLINVGKAELALIETKWMQAAGRSPNFLRAWSICNPDLDRRFEDTAQHLAGVLGHACDIVDGWHGTPEHNILQIALHGFDPCRRSAQAFGVGEYFAYDPRACITYTRGGAFVFLCKLLLGTKDDHSWVRGCKYYIVKQYNDSCQALPVYVVQFKPSEERLALRLRNVRDRTDETSLRCQQYGSIGPCKARRWCAGMTASVTRYLWLGWLDPDLVLKGDEVIKDDVESFLWELPVIQVIPERNGLRIGAFVQLGTPISQAKFREISKRLYRGRWEISVDDQQINNPRHAGRLCPHFLGPSRYCRGWNISGHKMWRWACPFSHPPELRPTYNVDFETMIIQKATAKYDEITTAFLRSAPFHDGAPKILGVYRIINHALEEMYEKRRSFLADKHGAAIEMELWHGTSCTALREVCTHGLQPPSDVAASEHCPVSGNKELSTSLCDRECRYCVTPHKWGNCHMYGLGIYLADMSQKSHRHVRRPQPMLSPGVYIEGMDGYSWGKILSDGGDVWRLDSGNYARKANEGYRWKVCAREICCGIGALIYSTDDRLWGVVVDDRDYFWQLNNGDFVLKRAQDRAWIWKKISSFAGIGALIRDAEHGNLTFSLDLLTHARSSKTCLCTSVLHNYTKHINN